MSIDNMTSVMEEAAAAVADDLNQPEFGTGPSQDMDTASDAESGAWQSAMDDGEDDVPSFLETITNEESNVESSEESAPEENTVSESYSDLIKYSAEGKDLEATREEAAKALSLMKGARRAFSDRAKLSRKLKKLETQLNENKEFRAKWEEVMADGADPKRVVEKIIGQPLDNVVDEEIRRRQLYAQSTPEERKILDQNQELARVQKKMAKLEEATHQRETQSQERMHKARVKYLASIAEPEFEKHAEKFAGSTGENKLRRMLWLSSVNDLKTYKKEHGVNPNRKLISKVFNENANALAYGDSSKVQEKVEQVLDQKSNTAKVEARAASKQNYPGNVKSSDLVRKNPLDIFNALTGKN